MMQLLQRFMLVALLGVVPLLAAPPAILELREIKGIENLQEQATKLLDSVNRAEGNLFDVTMQNEYAALVEYVTHTCVNNQETYLKTILALLNKSKTTPLLSSAQQAYVARQLTPIIKKINTCFVASKKKSISAAMPCDGLNIQRTQREEVVEPGNPPAAYELTDIKQEIDAGLQLRKLFSFVNRAEGAVFDATMQNVYATLLEQIITEYARRQEEIISIVFDVLQNSITTPLLTSEQQTYTAKALLPMVQRVYACFNPAAARKKTKQQSGKVPKFSPLVTQFLDAAKNKTNFIEQVGILQQLVEQVQKTKFSISDQNRFAQQLNALFKKRPTSDAAAIAVLEKLCRAAATSPLLSKKQQNYVTTVMLKNMRPTKPKAVKKPAATVTPKPAQKAVAIPKPVVSKKPGMPRR